MAVTSFQDLSFHISLPAGKAGVFGIFGLGGMSYQITEAKKDSLLWEEDEFNRLNTKFYANTGVAGITHTRLFGSAYLRTAVAVSGTQNGYSEERLLGDYVQTLPRYREDYEQRKITVSSVFTKKINAKNNVRAGIIFNQLYLDLSQKSLADSGNVLATRIGIDGSSPELLKTLACCSGAVSQAASSTALSTFLPCLGTVRYEPPQLPPPPGTDVTSHLPAASGPAWSLILAICHAGHVTVANWPCLKPVFQTGVEYSSFADRPDWTPSTTRSQPALTSLFSPTTILSDLS